MILSIFRDVVGLWYKVESISGNPLLIFDLRPISGLIRQIQTP